MQPEGAAIANAPVVGDTTRARIEKEAGWNVVGGPFSGKSTLVRQLWSVGCRAFDTDDLRECLFSMAGYDMATAGGRAIWRAWDHDHPLHEEWKVVNARLREVETYAVVSGMTICSHSPIPMVAQGHALYLAVAGIEMKHRAEAYALNRFNDWRQNKPKASGVAIRPDDIWSRLAAAISYYVDVASGHKDYRGLRTVSNVQALSLILGRDERDDFIVKLSESRPGDLKRDASYEKQVCYLCATASNSFSRNPVASLRRSHV